MRIRIPFMIMAAITCIGCSYCYNISVSGLVVSEEGKVLCDVMISTNADGPGPTEKWSGPDGTFTPFNVQFSDSAFNGGKLPSAFLWFVKEGYETQKVEIKWPHKPKSFSDVPKLRINVKLKPIVR